MISLQKTSYGSNGKKPRVWRGFYRDLGCLTSEDRPFVSSLAATFRDLPGLTRWIYAGSGPFKRIVGWIAFGPDTDERGNDCFWIHRIAVNPRVRRWGIASKAIRLAIDEAPLGTEVLTSVVPGNRRAAAMFRKLGFRRTARKWESETIYRWRKRRYWK
jgi:ribosomal protein S18 acetylase RimI-like enzyme